MDFVDTVQRLNHRLDAHLPQIKESLNEEISSARTKSRIGTFEELVKILIKRDLVHPTPDGWSLLNDICLRYLGEPFTTVSAQTHVPNHQESNSLIHTKVPVPEGEVPQIDPRVVAYIAGHIGQFQWRGLARALHVRESDISNLEGEKPPIAVSKILQLYVQRLLMPSRREVYGMLQQALRNIRRADLAEGVSKFI